MTTPAQQAAEKLQEQGCLRHPLSEQTVAAIISAAYAERDKIVAGFHGELASVLLNPNWDNAAKIALISRVMDEWKPQLREAIGKL